MHNIFAFFKHILSIKMKIKVIPTGIRG